MLIRIVVSSVSIEGLFDRIVRKRTLNIGIVDIYKCVGMPLRIHIRGGKLKL